MIHMYHINVVRRSADLWTFCRTWKGASAPSTSASTSASRRPERPGRSVSNLETPKDGPMACVNGECVGCCEWFAPKKKSSICEVCEVAVRFLDFAAELFSTEKIMILLVVGGYIHNWIAGILCN